MVIGYAAEQGDPWAQTSLVYAYQEALGVPRNDAEAEGGIAQRLPRGTLVVAGYCFCNT